jgi:flagellar basal body-associated protein FliL
MIGGNNMLRILLIVAIVTIVWAVATILACIIAGYCHISDDKKEPLLTDIKDKE